MCVCVPSTNGTRVPVLPPSLSLSRLLWNAASYTDLLYSAIPTITRRQRDRDRDRGTERQRDRETERQRDRETEPERDRQRDRETERQRD